MVLVIGTTESKDTKPTKGVHNTAEKQSKCGDIL